MGTGRRAVVGRPGTGRSPQVHCTPSPRSRLPPIPSFTRPSFRQGLALPWPVAKPRLRVSRGIKRVILRTATSEWVVPRGETRLHWRRGNRNIDPLILYFRLGFRSYVFFSPTDDWSESSCRVSQTNYVAASVVAVPGSNFIHFNKSRRQQRATSVGVALGLLLGEEVLLELPHEGLLLGGRLEAAVAELGARVDELELDLLQGPALGVGEEAL